MTDIGGMDDKSYSVTVEPNPDTVGKYDLVLKLHCDDEDMALNVLRMMDAVMPMMVSTMLPTVHDAIDSIGGITPPWKSDD